VSWCEHGLFTAEAPASAKVVSVIEGKLGAKSATRPNRDIGLDLPRSAQ
jgi:hypothetical protein